MIWYQKLLTFRDFCKCQKSLTFQFSFSCLFPDVAEEKEEAEEEDSDDEEEEDDEDDDTEVKEENGVLILTNGNYDTFMEGKDTVLVEFYAPWCVCYSSVLFIRCSQR